MMLSIDFASAEKMKVMRFYISFNFGYVLKANKVSLTDHVGLTVDNRSALLMEHCPVRYHKNNGR